MPTEKLVIPKRVNDLHGRQFGQLKVLTYAGLNKRGGATWRCICACGNTTIVDSANLVANHSTSCGKCRSSPSLDLTGKRFGRLKAMFAIGSDKHGHMQWCCVCDCGNAVTATAHGLVRTTNGVRSCGCLLEDVARERMSKLSKDRWRKLSKADRTELGKSFSRAQHYKSLPLSMSAAVAANALNVPVDTIRTMVATGELSGRTFTGGRRRGTLWVSSQQVMQILAKQQRRKKHCTKFDAAMFAKAKHTKTEGDQD